MLLSAVSAQAALPTEPLFFWAHDNERFPTAAMDIDKAGNVVGYYYPNSRGQGFIRSAAGTYTDLISTLPGTYETYPVAMNKNTIVGSSSVRNSGDRSWAYDRATGVYTLIHLEGAYNTFAEGINSAGIIVGTAEFYSDDFQTSYSVGFTLENGVYRVVTTPGQESTRLHSINDEGRIGGTYGESRGSLEAGVIIEPDGSRTAIVTQPGRPKVLPYSLSNSGDIVSTCNRGDDFYNVCLQEGPTGRSFNSSAPIGCRYFNPSVGSMKYSAVVGRCYDWSSHSQAFVMRKSDIYKYEVP